MFSRDFSILIFFLIFLGLLVGVLGAFIVLFVQKYQRTYFAGKQKLEDLRGEYEDVIIKSQLEIQEQTFQHISDEIHDNIGQKLSLAKLHLNTLGDMVPAGVTGKIEESVAILTEVIADLRNLSRAMNADLVMQNGLIRAIENEIGQLNRSGMYKLKLTVTGESAFLDSRKDLVLFRIIQESLNNIVKHAHARSIHIRLHYRDHELQLEVEDDGRGFSGEPCEGAGLLNIRRRAAVLSGTAEVRSTPGKGTIVQINIPIHGTEEMAGDPGR